MERPLIRRRWRFLLAARCAAVLALIAVSAHASPSARLTYARSQGAEHCPDEAVLRHAVEQRLGYDPFFPWANRTMVARIRSDARGLHGTVEMLDAAGLVQGSREISAPPSQCSELLAGMALAISIAIDPSHVDRGPGTGKDEPEPDAAVTEWSSARAAEEAASRPPPPVAHDARPSSPPADAAAAWVPEVAAGAAFAVGVLPGFALGPSLGAALRRRAWSFGVEGRYLFSTDSSLKSANVSSTVLEGAAVGCFHAGAPFACLVGSVGYFAVSGNVAHPNDDGAAVGRLGPRLGVELAVTPQIALRAQADVVFNLGKQSIEVNSLPVWTSPLVGGIATIDVRGRFP